MKSDCLVLVLSIMCYSCNPSGSHLILNSRYKETIPVDTHILIPTGSFADSHTVIENGIKYTVGVLDGRIVYVGTIDESFTISGLRINDRLPESYNDREWGYRPGWGYFREIDSGWYAGFDFQTKPTEESQIGWFFKYGF